MKHLSLYRLRNIRLIIVFAILMLNMSAYSQSDTLHVYFQGSLTKVLDSNEVKIGNWVKNLKGKKVNLDILGYYEKSEFKPQSNERVEGIFLVVNRKARDLVTIKSMGPVKGKKSQRSTVDIVYNYVDSSPVMNPPVNTDKKEEKNVNSVEKKQVDKDKPVTEKKEEKEKQKEKVKSEPKEKIVIEEGYTYDSIYVNQVLKVTKRKIKKN